MTTDNPASPEEELCWWCSLPYDKGHFPEFKVIVLREISREQAKQEIRSLFEGGEVLDYEDIVERLRLDLEDVVALCQELMDEGAIAPKR